MNKIPFKKEHRVLLIVLPLIILTCLFLWYLRNFYHVRFVDFIRVEEENGTYDLTEIDFETGFVRLQGDIEYLPGILTPEEFAERESEAVKGYPYDLHAATSRMIVKFPDDGVYFLTTTSMNYAHRIYIDKELRHESGTPAESKEDFIPGYAQFASEVIPKNGILEIIQQGANFVHRENDGHGAIYVGKPEVMRRYLALTSGLELITFGLFAALFFVHLILFIVRRSYPANLTFSLLCFAWMVRSGLTGSKVLYSLFPSLPWQAGFRTEYLSIPAACFLTALLARQMFPGIPQKWFVRIVGAVSSLFAILCVVTDTVFLSWALLPFEGFFTAAIIYLCVRFVMKIPGMVKTGQFEIEHFISLAGFICFMYAGIHDALYHLDIRLLMNFSLTGAAMLIFSFLQMTAMFYGTMRETVQAHERERKAEADKEMLSEMNRLKSAFYTDLSHEMKTPLTVIAVNAQFAAQNLKAGAADEETATDLNAISAEARRLAQMVTSLVGIGRMQGTSGDRNPISLDALLTETARIYQALFFRRNNVLTVVSSPELFPVEGNADRLIQVLINLLSNANRHTTGDIVSMRAENSDDRVRISVTDNGSGISPDLLPHVFDRYLRGKDGGAGLGLPICKSIIEEHGGEIGIESEEGKGTQVWFTLPALRKEESEHERDRDNPVGRGR